MYSSYSYSRSIFDYLWGGGWQFIVGTILALTCAVLLYVLVFPKRMENRLPGFFRVLRDFFDVRYLLIEKIFKFLYVFSTLAVIFIGFFYLFGNTFVYVFILMLLGPVFLRIMYELFMLIILLVKNVMEINRQLKKHLGTDDSKDANPFEAGIVSGPAPYTEAAPAPAPAPYGRVCPYCGADLEDGDVFCRSCGNRV